MEWDGIPENIRKPQPAKFNASPSWELEIPQHTS
jgi:hypothetical protein